MTEIKELPPRYYLHYFEYMLAFIQEKCSLLLMPAEQQFLGSYQGLSEDARCLFVRLVNRKGLFFRVAKLSYSEIDMPSAWQQLHERGFVQRPGSAQLHELAQLLDIYTKDELIAIARPLLPADTKTQRLKRDELLALLLEQVQAEALLQAIVQSEHIVRQGYENEVEMLKFLFFGNRYDDMTGFVIRDLGNARYEVYDDSKLTPYFKSRREAEEKLAVSKAFEKFYELCNTATPVDEIYHWFVQWQSENTPGTEAALPLFDKLLLKIAAILEKAKMPEEALLCYQLTLKPPSRERQVRLLWKKGDSAQALLLCEYMLESAQNSEEQFFAADFLRKQQNKKSVKTTTSYLSEAETIQISAEFRNRVELGVIHWFEQQGQQAIWSENHVWRSLFGLLFWDIVFDENAQAIHHPLQRRPSDFYLPGFWQKREQLLHQRLSEIADEAQFLYYIQKTFTEKYQISNPFTEWYEALPAICRLLYQKLGSGPLSAVLLEMAKNLREGSKGFPDLLVWSEQDYCFVEVKSPTDTLSARQLFWMQFFKQAGIKARVLRVEWLAQEEP